MNKNIFVDRHEQSDTIEHCNNFLTKIKKLKLYMVEFKRDNLMKPKYKRG